MCYAAPSPPHNVPDAYAAGAPTLRASPAIFAPAPLPVAIDVKPGSRSNLIDLDDGCDDDDSLRVAILTTPDLDARTVDPSTVKFGDPSLSGTMIPRKSKPRDVDRDRDIDLLLVFSHCDMVNNGAIDIHTTELILTGKTFDGVSVVGSDGVRVVADDDD